MAVARARILVALTLTLVFAVACGNDAGDGTAVTETPGAQTPAPTAMPGTPSAGAPAAPSNVAISGRIPDLTEPVPPGEGEAGRISVEWTDNSDNEDGFRIWTEECEQPLAIIAETPANETSYGPLNPCRPARVGVSAFNAEGDSDIVWAQ